MRVVIDTASGKITVDADREDDGYVTVHPSVYRQPGQCRQPGEGEPTPEQRRTGVYDQPGRWSR